MLVLQHALALRIVFCGDGAPLAARVPARALPVNLIVVRIVSNVPIAPVDEHFFAPRRLHIKDCLVVCVGGVRVKGEEKETAHTRNHRLMPRIFCCFKRKSLSTIKLYFF